MIVYTIIDRLINYGIAASPDNILSYRCARWPLTTSCLITRAMPAVKRRWHAPSCEHHQHLNNRPMKTLRFIAACRRTPPGMTKISPAEGILNAASYRAERRRQERILPATFLQAISILRLAPSRKMPDACRRAFSSLQQGTAGQLLFPHILL